MLLSATDMLALWRRFRFGCQIVSSGVMDALGITALKVQRSPKEDVPL